MCTVTFLPRGEGYLLGMNRDERLDRIAALPPAHRRAGELWALSPSEPAGGTWIGVNQIGITFALINWYAVPFDAKAVWRSRGLIVRNCLEAESSSEVDAILERCALESIRPFRVIGLFPDEQVVLEWRWDLRRLHRVRHAWAPGIWISSGFDEPGAEKARRRVFESSVLSSCENSTAWLRRLHGSHLPECGPYSICMHRSGAGTVSYSEIEVRNRRVRMSYLPSALCEHRNRRVQSRVGEKEWFGARPAPVLQSQAQTPTKENFITAAKEPLTKMVPWQHARPPDWP